MGRLVDVDEVIKAVDKHTKDESEIVLDDDITCILEEVPTAYDIEMVVAELKKTNKDEVNAGVCPSGFIHCLTAIDIVKRGGVG